MKTGMIFLLSALITVGLALGSFMFRDPLPPFIVAILSFPIWIMTFIVLTRKLSGSVDILQLQSYANISRIRQNTERIK